VERTKRKAKVGSTSRHQRCSARRSDPEETGGDHARALRHLKVEFWRRRNRPIASEHQVMRPSGAYAFRKLGKGEDLERRGLGCRLTQGRVEWVGGAFTMVLCHRKRTERSDYLRSGLSAPTTTSAQRGVSEGGSASRAGGTAAGSKKRGTRLRCPP